MAGALVQFTPAAIEDLQRLARKDRPLVRRVLEKCLLIEQNPFAGRPLHGELGGYRKLIVGNRHLRIVWKVIADAGADSPIVEVAEIWAVGVRADSEVYDEVRTRLAAAPDTRGARTLHQVVSMLDPGDHVEAFDDRDDPVPNWLHDRLVHTVGLTEERIAGLTGAEAFEIWNEYMVTPKS